MTLTSRDLLGLGAAPALGPVLAQDAAPAQVSVAIVQHTITLLRDARCASGCGTCQPPMNLRTGPRP